MNHVRTFFGATWVALGSLTLAQINVALGTLSLVVGIGYQLWKWRRDARRAAREDHPLD